MKSEIITGRQRYSLSEVKAAALNAAAEMADRGVRSGDRVLLTTDNSVDHIVALLALIHLDTSIVLVDHHRTPDRQRETATRTRAAWVVHHTADTVAGTVAEAAATGPGPASLRVEELTAERSGGARGELRQADWYGRRDALICWSSGTAGEPKAVVRSGASVLRNIEATADRMSYRPDDVLLPLLPFSHQYGLSMVLLWWMTECALVVPSSSRLDQALACGAEAGVTVVDAAPSTYHGILKLVARRPVLGEGLRPVRMFCVGGAPLGPGLARTFRRAMGRPLIDGYGSTEAGNIALAVPENAIGCGRPVDGVELTIRTEAGAPAPAGTVGEISVRTPGLMAGYLTADGELEPLPHDRHDRNGRYDTGDLGYRDTEGNVFVVGRKNAVHRLGHTLYPEALAAAAEVCGRPVRVVPLPDERLGSRLVFVVEDETGRDARHWRRLMSPALAAHEQPNQVLTVPRFPVNRRGKTDLRQLADLVTAALTSVPPAPPHPDTPDPDPVTGALTSVPPAPPAPPHPDAPDAAGPPDSLLPPRRDRS
ncbi:class I adenylate-forming enzyme family protein [Streptomyces sp. NPDC055078]